MTILSWRGKNIGFTDERDRDIFLWLFDPNDTTEYRITPGLFMHWSARFVAMKGLVHCSIRYCSFEFKDDQLTFEWGSLNNPETHNVTKWTSMGTIAKTPEFIAYLESNTYDRVAVI